MRYSLILFIGLFPFWGFTQDLCNIAPAGYSRFTPTVNQSTICSGETVTINLTGITDFTIYQGYTNQALNELNTLSQSTTATLSLTNIDPTDKNITLLIVGQRAGQRVIGCVNVLVRPIRTPSITYEACTNGQVFLFLDDPINIALGKLKIDWNDGRVIIVDPKTDPILKENFPVSPTITSRIFTIGPADGVTCGTNAPIEVNMRGKNNFTVITNLTPSPDNPKEVTFDLENAARGNYDLFIRRFDESYQSDPSEPPVPYTTISSGRNRISLPDKDGPFCFAANRRDYCPSNISNEICQVVLDQIVVLDKSTNQLEWTLQDIGRILGLLPRIGEDTKVNSNTITVLKYDSKDDVKSGTPESKLADVNLRLYKDTDASCQKEPCYQIVWRTEGQLRSMFPASSPSFTALSYSNLVCVDRETLPRPPAPEAWVSVLSDTEVQVNALLATPADWPTPVSFYSIRNQSDDFVGPQLSWTDATAKPTEGPACYQIQVTDECMLTSDWSENVCTIHLKAQSTTQIEWTNQSPFSPNPITGYAIFSSENGGSNVEEASYTPLNTTHFPELDRFTEAGTYVVEATSANGRSSLSNRLRIPLQFKLFLPNAFTPNNDGVNDLWGPQGRLVRLQSYSLKVFSRAGHLLWQGTQPSDFWDGTRQGQPLPAGKYGYRLELKTTDEAIQRAGSVHLIR